MSLSAMPAGSGSSMSWFTGLPRDWLEFVGLRRVSFECGRSGDAGLAWLAIPATLWPDAAAGRAGLFNALPTAEPMPNSEQGREGRSRATPPW